MPGRSQREAGIEEGDLVLARTKGVGYAMGRWATRNPYDHVAVVIPGQQTLNIVSPRAVILPLSVFFGPGKNPVVIRPRWPGPVERAAFIAEMERLSAARYDLVKTLFGIPLTFLRARLGIELRLRKPTPAATRWICTEAIITALMACSKSFEAITAMDLDFNRLGFATTNDFLRMARQRPDLFEVLRALAGPRPGGRTARTVSIPQDGER